MPKFRKKPVVIEAMLHDINQDDPMAVYQWVEENTLGSFEPMACISGSKPYPESGISIDPRDGRLLIATLEGGVHASLGDYIIKGVNGEFYPCKPEIFIKTYDQVDAPVKCTAPQDPDHELTEDEGWKWWAKTDLPYGSSFVQLGGDCPIEEGDEFDFGSAVYLLKIGKKVARKGWNGSGMFVYYVPAASYPVERNNLETMGGQFPDDMVPYREYLALKTAQGDVATWAPSVSDALATDWCLA